MGYAAWLGLGLAFLAGPGGAAEPCPKLALNRYCLGTELDALVRQPPAPLFQQQEGERRAAIYAQGPERVYVMAFRNRIYKVLREYGPGTEFKHRELLASLEAKYGKAEDRSQYPAYADSGTQRMAAIRRGDGLASHRWPLGPDWHLELSWTRELGLALAYVDDALDAERRRAAEPGL